MRSLFFLFMCSGLFGFYQAKAALESVKPKVIVEVIKYSEDFQKLLYPARINAKLNSTVTADLDGHVVKIVKALGSYVRAHDTILYLENTDPAFTYSAVAVRAPVSGVLSQVNFQLMSKVNKGDKLFTVINPSSVNLEIEIPAAEIAYLRVGSAGEFQLSTNSENSLPVRIVGLSPVVDVKSGTASAELEFIKSSTKSKANVAALQFPVGTVGQVIFHSSLGKALLVSENAISYFEGKPTLYLLDASNKSHRKTVELGEQRDSLIIVKKGLQEGDKVIVRSNKNVKEGEEVEVQNLEPKVVEEQKPVQKPEQKTEQKTVEKPEHKTVEKTEEKNAETKKTDKSITDKNHLDKNKAENKFEKKTATSTDNKEKSEGKL